MGYQIDVRQNQIQACRLLRLSKPLVEALLVLRFKHDYQLYCVKCRLVVTVIGVCGLNFVGEAHLTVRFGEGFNDRGHRHALPEKSQFCFCLCVFSDVGEVMFYIRICVLF